MVSPAGSGRGRCLAVRGRGQEVRWGQPWGHNSQTDRRDNGLTDEGNRQRYVGWVVMTVRGLYTVNNNTNQPSAREGERMEKKQDEPNH